MMLVTGDQESSVIYPVVVVVVDGSVEHYWTQELVVRMCQQL